jgi:hypothetical protein
MITTRVVITLILATLSLSATAEEPAQKHFRELYPWIFKQAEMLETETITKEEILAYCAKHETEFYVWHEEYTKRFGGIEAPEVPDEKKRPEDGLLSGVAQLHQMYFTFFIQKRASLGWMVVGASNQSFVFGKPKDNDADDNQRDTPSKDAQGNSTPTPASESLPGSSE